VYKVGLLQWNTSDDVQAVDLHLKLTESVSFQQVNAECGNHCIERTLFRMQCSTHVKMHVEFP